VLTVGGFALVGDVVDVVVGDVVVVAAGDVVVVAGDVVVVVGDVVVVDSLVGETPLVVVVASGVDAPAVVESGNATRTMEAASNMVNPTMWRRR
jgi:hypothetical protein